MAQNSKGRDVDGIDAAILSELTTNARASHVELATRVGLSSTAIARRQRALEGKGIILGYQALLYLGRIGITSTVPCEARVDFQRRTTWRAPARPSRVVFGVRTSETELGS